MHQQPTIIQPSQSFSSRGSVSSGVQVCNFHLVSVLHVRIKIHLWQSAGVVDLISRMYERFEVYVNRILVYMKTFRRGYSRRFVQGLRLCWVSPQLHIHIRDNTIFFAPCYTIEATTKLTDCPLTASTTVVQ